MNAPGYTVVVPTAGRSELARCLSALAVSAGPAPQRVIVVDDRPAPAEPLRPAVPPGLSGTLAVLRSEGRGPAGARNVGWAGATTPWVAFLDDDVTVSPTWRADLATDLRRAPSEVGGIQGRIEVPLPSGREPTDWERATAGLASARWVTADMAYRRAALTRVGGFDERFRRAYREDADIALRVRAVGYDLDVGHRITVHPVRPARAWASVRAQVGNADDALMRGLHGRGWRERAAAPRGRRPRHLAVTGAAASALALAGAGWRRAALGAATVWAAGTAEFAWARIRPGPKTAGEVGRMAATSLAIPAAASYHWLGGLARHRGPLPWAERSPWAEPPSAVLFDRDGTLVHDEPYSADPERVRPVPGAREALERLRAAGYPVGVVSNQSGVARRLLDAEAVEAVNGRVEELLGPFAAWAWCGHGPEDGCACRKPAPGLVLRAAHELGLEPHQCLVVGDTGSDVAAARAAGARPVLVPTAVTRRRELGGTRTAPDIATAVEDLLAGDGDGQGDSQGGSQSGRKGGRKGGRQGGSAGRPGGRQDRGQPLEVWREDRDGV